MFRFDCVREGTLSAFDCLSEMSLRMLWEFGVEPSVKAVSALLP